MRLYHVLLGCVASPLLSGPVIAGQPAVETKAAAPARAAAQPPAADIAAAKAAVRSFIDRVDIPYESFTLPNGLRVLVHSDHSVPKVNVSVWYDVGSKHEPAGRSGFAHLFEHLMFNGSENVPGDYLKPLMAVGADVNGSTTADRTSYYETVPTQALDRALFMESDRMGHLVGAIGQPTLDEQRGVVQNEKRQGDDGPISIVEYVARAALYPASHPYGHSVIGSMKDLKSADLDDVRQWFGAHYGPNNALLVLSGDVDPATAHRLVTRYFGGIPAGPRNVRPVAGPVPMARTISETVTAPVTSPVIVREWPVPGADAADGLALDGVMEVMGSGDDNVLTRRLVRERQLFQRVSVNNSSHAQAGEFRIVGTVRPGIDPGMAAAALDAEIADFLRQAPSEDAVTRFVARYTYGFVHRLENVAGRGSTLGESAMVAGDPDAYKANLRFYAAQTPASLIAVARRWLDRPRYELTVLPGPRTTPKDDAGIDGSDVAADAPTTGAAAPAAAPAVDAAVAAPAGPGRRGPLPIVGPPGDSRFPAIEHARLGNGIPVLYARHPGVPFTLVGLDIDGGTLVEPHDTTGTMDMMYGLLDEGFGGHDEHWIAQRKELLGLSLGAGVSAKAAGISLDAPDSSLGEGLEMMLQMMTSPDFAQEALDRKKRERLDLLSGLRLNPGILMTQVMAPRVDTGSPYNRVMMYDDVGALRRIDRAAVTAAFARWVRPEHAHVRVVSDRPLSELIPMLDRTIGRWKASGAAVPVPPVVHVPRPATPQVVLVDLPGAVQATVEGAQTIPIGDAEPGEALNIASSILGAGFTSRINMNLREDKHWTYGSYGYAIRRPYGSQYTFSGTIQQDKVGPAIAEVMREVRGIVGDRPITADEFDRAKAAAAGRAASAYSDRYAIMSAIEDVREHRRPDGYPAATSERYRAVTLDQANAILRLQLAPSTWVWGVVGNAAIIRPQLEKLGMPVVVVKPEDVLPPM